MKKYQSKKFLAKACATTAIVGLLMTGCGSKRGDDTTTEASQTTTQAGTNADPSGESTEPTTSAVIDPNDYVVDLDSIVISDYLDISKVKDLKIKTSDVTATDTFIKYNVDISLVNNYGLTLTEQNRAVKAGDTVTIDYKGYINGIRFDGGVASGYELGIGSGKFIPGFEDGIIGHTVNDEFDLRVTFPEDYSDKDYAGREAVFKVKISKIQALETTDNEVKEKTSGKYETYQAFFDEKSVEVKQNYHDSIILGKIMSVVDEKKQHEGLVNEYVQDQLARVDSMCASYGVDRLTYLNALGYDASEFESILRENGQAYAKQKLTILAICREEGYKIEDGEMEEFKKRLVTDYKLENEEKLMEIMTADELEYQLFYDKFLEYLKNYKTED
ncbi:MAG: FKBP-type peptidyl-prolyl cis-trans isomerase [Lachnospiraceae bacterium]|nr:FKBP-type peptidyl-prolyl cis-trans isomerase [Lachnospiraceae bacterium]